MSNKEKSIYIISFSGNNADLESWSEKFLSYGKWKRYKMLSSRSTSGMDKIPTHNEYKNPLEFNIDLDEKIIKLGELNDLSHEYLVLSIHTSSFVG